MSDEMDRVQAANEKFQEDALAEQLRRVTSGISKLYCDDCGEPIPQARRKAVRGCTRCVSCQTAFEIQSGGRVL